MKLSDHKGEKGTQIATKLFRPIFKLCANEKVREARKQKGAKIEDILITMVENEPDAAMELYAIINEKDVDEYKKTVTAGDMLNNIFDTFSDDQLMELFGLRIRTTDKTSSVSVSQNKGASKK